MTTNFSFMKTHIINILTHEPDYRFLHDKDRPPVNWDTSEGNWVGIYRNEIPDKLGEEVLKYSDDFVYEVWQPDYRADKVYSHQFEDGLIHRLFPAQHINEYYGIKKRKQLDAPAILQYLQQFQNEHDVILNLNGDLCRLNYQLLAAAANLPILYTFRGTLHLPNSMIFRPRLNLPASFTYFLRYLKARKLMPKADYVTYMNDLYLDDLGKLYRGPKAKLTSGCDFSFWKKTSKSEARKALDIAEDIPVFFTSSLLIPIKQVDKVIEIFDELARKYDFLLMISGHGTEAYEAKLNEKAKTLLKQEKVRFTGYLTGELLRNHYNASDLFINASVSEGGPASAMKAAACETPIFSTNVGNVAERMASRNAGIICDIQDYDAWKEAFRQVLEGDGVKTIDRQIAYEHYDWQQLAAQFTHIYQYLEERYYGSKDISNAQDKKSEIQQD
mgnify:CR=1 FL=1